MPLGPGETLLHFRLVEKIGEGGMGVVWKAVDTTLDREVAVKILPEHLAADAERLARFEREAKLLASLNHPNIAAVYGLHEARGVRFLVMELVPGEDLAVRLARGRLPLEEALGAADQIAEALEAAHDAGVIHRDLKPANVVVNEEGRAKVLDFGLAKALSPSPASASGDPSLSPTLTSAGTVAGVILGTAGYMSPEQARGHAAGPQADIWSFGAVLYELLTGRRAFRGETVSDTLAAVLKDEPDWSALPAETPPSVRRLLRRCLAKDRRQRLRHIGDARLDLQATAEVIEPETRPRAPAWAWLLVVTAVAVAALVAGSRVRDTGAVAPELPHRQYALTLPGLTATAWSRPVISPDGRRLAYRVRNRLMIRDLDTLDDRPVPGGEDGNAPFWSPDGEWLAFAGDSRLWKVPAAGGQPVMLCDLPDQGRMMSGAWSQRDRIAISIWRGAIYELPAHGGVPRVRLEPDAEIGSDFQNLAYLPDGETLLTTPHPQSSGPVAGANMGKILAIRGTEASVVMGDDDSLHCHDIAWSPTGHLLYSRAFTNAGVWAVPFSPDRLEPAGEPFLVASAAGDPSIADDGTLAYRPDPPDVMHEMVWVGRNGEVLETVGTPAEALESPALAPNGTRVAYAARPETADHQQIFVQDLAGGVPLRMTFTEHGGDDPAWSADGGLIVFRSGSDVAVKPADGTGELQSLFPGFKPTITPDGLSIIYHDNEMGEKLSDVMLRPLDGSGEPTVLLGGPSEEEGRLSPRGDYLAYRSSESGRDEIYLTRYPDCEGKWQVSTHGGRDMRWVGRGDELLFRGLDGAMMAVGIRRSPTLQIAEPVRLFGDDEIDGLIPNHGFDVSADGKRLLMVRRLAAAADAPTIVVVQNWLAGLE